MKQLMRLLALALVVMMTLGMATFASAEESDVIFRDLSFSWYKNYDWYSADKWGEGNEGDAYIIDTYGVNIDFQDAGGAASQKLVTMMIDGEYPDVISLDNDQNLQKLISSGALVPLDDYLDKYPNLRKYLGDELLDMFRASDGHLYCFPNWAAPVGCPAGNSGYLVEEKYYNALGCPELKTFDDLYNYLVAVKEAYPDVIPLEIGSELSGMYVMYGGMAENNNPGYMVSRLAADGDGVKGYLEDASVQDTLVFLNKLYREKLMTQDSFTMTSDDLTERIRNGRVAVACLNDVYEWYDECAELKAEDPETGMFHIDPIVAQGVNVENTYTNFNNGMGWNVSVITKNAQNPEAIFAFLDWWFGNEGQLVSAYGNPGYFYDFGDYTEEGYPVKMNDVFFTATNDEIDSKWLDTNWVGNTNFINNMAKYIYDTTGKGQELKIDQFMYSWNHCVDITDLANTIPDFDTDMGILYQNIEAIYQQAIPEILVAGSEEECRAAIDKYIVELKDAGIADLLAWQNNIISQNRETLGLK